MTKRYKSYYLLYGTLVLSLVCTGPATVTAYPKNMATKQTPFTHISTNSMNQNGQPAIQYHIQAKLNTDNMTITGKQMVKYRNTSADKLNHVIFHVFADAHRSKKSQSSLYVFMNDKIAKENSSKRPEDFLGGIDVISVKDITLGCVFKIG